MSNKYNQFIKHQMNLNQPDTEKLIKIASFLRQKYGLTVHREPIFLFNRWNDKFVQFASWITEEQYKKHIIHVPDLMFHIGKDMWIIEVDGYIHNTNATVAIKDIERNRIYDAAKLNWMKINEWEVLIKLGKNPDRSATAKEVITEVDERLGKLIRI